MSAEVGSQDQEEVIERFCRYLRIKSVHPEPDYDGCVSFLREQAAAIGLQCRVVEPVAGKPIVIMSWPGRDPNLQSLLLNSHTDVVPVFENHWKCDPFSAHRDAEGRIFARGTQDMKSVGMQYLEALRRLKHAGFSPLRSLHLTFVPDEEIGGVTGMAAFLATDDWRALNVGCTLDEGLANPTDHMTVFYAERHTWKVEFTCSGNTGHGSRFVQNTAAEKLRRLLDSILDYRAEQELALSQQPNATLGDVTTVNLTIVQGGVLSNVVPDSFRAVFDVRVAQRTSPDEFERRVADWCQHAAGHASGGDGDGGVTYRFQQREDNPAKSPLQPDNRWWAAFDDSCRRMGITLDKEVFPAGTDSRFLRRLGIPCYGFSPMNNTPILLHDHNEFIGEQVYLRGIDIYVDLIKTLTAVASDC